MRKEAKGLSAIKLLRKAGVKKLPAEVRRGLKKSLEDEVPFVTMPFNWAGKKIFGEKAVKDFWYKKFQKPISNFDIGAGQILQKGIGKLTGGRGKNFMSVKKVLPTSGTKNLATGGKQYYIPSGLAPAAKVSAMAVPFLAASKVEDMLNKGKKMNANKNKDTVDLSKTAAAMLSSLNEERNQLKKEAKATELLYKQAELGQIKMPSTFAEYQEKVATLLGKDLNIMEEAIKIASSSENEIGGLDNSQLTNMNAEIAFQQAILD